ncbi:hypothetical protein, partial [Planktothrix sp.]|uniref:hypothetical protein n=1 Tax=Planktothrix sp. TaxID=3088171 RepID=UPI0038D39C72
MECVSYGGLIPPYKAMLESFKFGLAVCLGYLISFGFNQVQTTAYQVNLESQNKSLKTDYSQ